MKTLLLLTALFAASIANANNATIQSTQNTTNGPRVIKLFSSPQDTEALTITNTGEYR